MEKTETVTPEHITERATKDATALPDLWTDRARTMTREEAATMLDNMGRTEDAAAMRRGEIQDVYDPSTRRAVIVPENMRDKAQADGVMREVAIHDLLNHPRMQDALRQFFDEHMTADDVAGFQKRGYIQQKGESLDAYKQRLADEWIAQNGKANTTLWQKFVAWVQRAAQRLFGKYLTREQIASNYIDKASRLHADEETGHENIAKAGAEAVPSYAREGNQEDYLNDRLEEINRIMAKKASEVVAMRERGESKADIAAARRTIENLRHEKADLIAERDDRSEAENEGNASGEALGNPAREPGAKYVEPADDVGTIHPFRPSKLFLGTKDILNRTPGLEFFGKADEQHVDTAAKYQGELTAPFREWARQYNRADRRVALKEFEKYWGAKDSKDPRTEEFYNKSSAAGRALIDAWKDQATRMGQVNMLNNVMVHDPTMNGGKGGVRPVGMVKDYFPRMIKQEVLDAIKSPNRYPSKFAEIQREMEAAGFAKNKESVLAMVRKQYDGITQTDHFGNIEKARLLKLPSSLYDYRFGTVQKYIQRWSERMGQIEAFGKKIGANGKDLFDEAIDHVNEMRLQGKIDDDDAKATIQYINDVRDRAYGKKSNGPIAWAMRNLNALATGLHLGNPANVAMNIQNGIGYNFNHFGIMAGLKGMAEMHLAGRFLDTMREAQDKGVNTDDLMSMVRDTEAATGGQEATQRFSSAALHYSGYESSIYYIRAVGMATSKAYLRAAIDAFDKAPNSNASMQYAAFLKRNGADFHRLWMENGAGPATDAFLRGSVNDVHGGYRYDQTPVWMDTPTGRFLFKYQKWGSQMARNAYINVFEPAIKGTDVRHVVDGKMTTTNVRSYAPLVRFAVMSGLIGWEYDKFREWAFGGQDITASFDEIGKTLDHNFSRGLALIADKYITEVINGGALGTFGNYAQLARDYSDRSRFKNPLSPPALGVLTPSAELAMRLKEQGTLTGADMENWLSGTSSQFRVLEQSGSRLLSAVDPSFAAQSSEMKREDLSWLRNITNRYASEVGLNSGNRMNFQRVAKTPDSPYKDAIREALLTGDRQTAHDELAAFKATKPAALWPQRWKRSKRACEPASL